MKKFYRNLFQVYLFMARALFPKDSALQREFLLIKVSGLEKECPKFLKNCVEYGSYVFVGRSKR